MRPCFRYGLISSLEDTILKRWRDAIFALTVVVLASGCIPTQQDLRMERDLEEMKRRLASVERNAVVQKQGVPAERRVEDVGRQVADLQASLDTLRVDVQAINGRLDDMSKERNEIREELSLVKDDLGLKVSALEDKVNKLSAGNVSAPTATAPAASSDSLYETGLDLIRQKGNYAEGRKVMGDFLQANPGSPLAVNAMYWIGEAYYGEFQDVIQKYPDNPKAAAAMLKQGFAFHALGDIKNAKVIMQKITETYPSSAEASKAKERLAAW